MISHIVSQQNLVLCS